MIWKKGAHQNAKFQTFDCSHKISTNLHFDRLLEVYKILVKKHRGCISHDPEGWCKIWRKTDLLFQKWQEFGEIRPEHLKISKTCTFICSCCAKYLMFDLKKYMGVVFHDTEGWCKLWRKTDLWFAKWHEEYGRALESLKVGSLMMIMNCFCGMVDRRKAFSLISSRDHCQRSSPSRISDTPRAGFEPAQNLSSGLVE